MERDLDFRVMLYKASLELGGEVSVVIVKNKHRVRMSATYNHASPPSIKPKMLDLFLEPFDQIGVLEGH